MARNLEPVDRCESLVTPECIPIPDIHAYTPLASSVEKYTSGEVLAAEKKNFDLIFLFEFIIFVLLIINFIK